MKIRVNQVKVGLNYTLKQVILAVANKLECKVNQIDNLELVSRSIDARSASCEPFYMFSVECDANISKVPSNLRENDYKIIDAKVCEELKEAKITQDNQCPLVVGAGPAGLMAALKLATAGFKPLLIDRGSDSQRRKAEVDDFWENEIFDAESNVLFGEGGAGLFSDGKLTARSKDNRRMDEFFDILVESGADESIKYDNLPHVGSDRLLDICPKIREMIIAKGGEVSFNARLDKLIFGEDGKVQAAIINGEEIAICDCVLAIGHSARDSYKMLQDQGVKLEAKAFAVGVRVEFPQWQVNQSQYGKWCNLPSLGAASYRLTNKESGEVRGTYSFCMCPGGVVIPCASEPKMVTSNGMSYDARNLPFSNSAFLVGVQVSDFSSVDALSGIDFQRKIEKEAYNCAKYGLVAQRLTDFLANRVSKVLPEERSYKNCVAGNLAEILPKFVVKALYKNIPEMLKKLKRVNLNDVLLYGPETRSSSPVRILRDENCQAVANVGLYPAGEGAGYAGGIVSSAIDGIRVAESIIRKYQ